MTPPTPRPVPDRDLASPVDRQLADALRDAGRSWGAVPEDVAARHLSAITALAAEHVHAAARLPAPTWRSRMRRVAGLTIVKVAVGAGVAAAATTGGLAAGGNLPDPVQGAVADGASWVGIDLPRPTPAATPDPADDVPESPAVEPEDRPADGPVDAPVQDAPDRDAPDRDAPVDAPADEDQAEGVPAPRPADPPADLPPSAEDDAGPPAEAPVGGDEPEADGRDERPTPPPASGPRDDDGDRAGARTTSRAPSKGAGSTAGR